jgi:hypothetical protein
MNKQQHTVQSKFLSGANDSRQSMVGWTDYTEGMLHSI